ncbi:MAG TPA: histidine kinase [Acidimicrobiales bacterium]|nr:histidine kinase [Acidimicrobiales bacterium]
MGLVSELRGRMPTRTERLVSLARVAALIGLLWVTGHQAPPKGVAGDHPAKWALMSVVGVGWLGWLSSRRFRARALVTWSFLALLAGSGGVLAAWAPMAITFLGVAGLGAGIVFEGLPLLGVGAVGVIGLAVATSAAGAPGILVAEGVLAVVVGAMVGSSRRQYVERADQAQQLLAERVRADSERDRAAALAERNRIGREVHDVLAHSLGALSVQLDAADALLENGTDAGKARRLVQQARRLAVQGLEETRQAVHALRDEPVALAEQLAALSSRNGAELTVTGAPRPLAPDAGLALYRAAQEAITNARKHAPGAAVSIQLHFDAQRTTLRITNGRGPTTEATTELATTGGGFGLQGMRERIELLGGQVVAEPDAMGFSVEVAVPQ